MPLYEYRCEKCEKEFEIIQKFSDSPLTVCEECSGPLEKKMSRTSFQLKGSGWYATDYKKTSTPKSNPTAVAPAAPPSPEKSTPPAPPVKKSSPGGASD